MMYPLVEAMPLLLVAVERVECGASFEGLQCSRLLPRECGLQTPLDEQQLPSNVMFQTISTDQYNIKRETLLLLI